MASVAGGFTVKAQMGGSLRREDDGYVTLIEYVGKKEANVGVDLVLLIDHLQYAFKRIAALVASPFNSSLSKQNMALAGGKGEFGRDAPKPLDLLSVSSLTSFFCMVGS